MLNILIIDDHREMLDIFSKMLEKYDKVSYVYTCLSLQEAESIIKSTLVDLVILDLNLEKTQGLQTLREFRVLFPQIPVIVVTGQDEGTLSFECFSLGASEFLSKPDITAVLLYKSCLYTAEKEYIRKQVSGVKEALSISEKRYRRLFECAQDGILILEFKTGKILDVNPYLVKMLGYSHEEFLGKFLWEVSPFKDTALNVASFKELQTLGHVRYEDLPLETVDGRSIDVEFVSNSYPVNGNTFIQCNIRDITDRRMAEEFIRIRLELLEFSARSSLADLLQKTLDEICDLTKSPVGFYHFVNEDENTISLQAWSTATFRDFCQAEIREQHYPIAQAGVWADAVRERQPVIHNNYAALPHRKGMPEGHAAIIRELTVPIIRLGRIVGVIGVGNKARDYNERDVEICEYFSDVAWEITDRKRAEEALRESESRIKVLEMAKTKDLLESSRLLNSGIAHELRTPMQALLNCFELIKEETCVECPVINCEKRQECLDKAQNIIDYVTDGIERSEYSIKVLNSLAEYSKTASNSDLHSIDVVAELKTIMKALMFTNQFKGLSEEEFSLESTIGCRILINRIDFAQLISNLCRNSLEAITSKEPRIKIGVYLDSPNVKITVTDNGRGIDENLGDKIFEPYFSTKENPKEYNQGLGLAMVRDITYAYSGSVRYTSEPGHTVFTVRFPCDYSKEQHGTKCV
jgi:PAS domain S-box-containing protein